MTAKLPSNDGAAQLEIEFVAPSSYACDPGYETAIRLHGQHDDGDHTFPVSISISGLWMRSVELIALRDRIARWLRQPLEYLTADSLDVDLQLAFLPGQSFRVRFAPGRDVKPVVSFSFSAGALNGEFCFVTDQSCLAQFERELSREFGS